MISKSVVEDRESALAHEYLPPPTNDATTVPNPRMSVILLLARSLCAFLSINPSGPLSSPEKRSAQRAERMLNAGHSLEDRTRYGVWDLDCRLSGVVVQSVCCTIYARSIFNLLVRLMPFR
jgi:hypothetical protein